MRITRPGRLQSVRMTTRIAELASQRLNVAGLKKYHYKQKCHNPCYLRNVPSEISGSPELQYCSAMNGRGRCNVCKPNCSFLTHMHIYYETELFEDKLKDQSVQEMINSNEDAVNKKEEHMKKLESLCKQYEYEQKVITKATAQFALFLKSNSLVVYNDFYLQYINYLIEREKGLGKNRDQNVIAKYEKQKKEYLQEKSILDDANKNSDGNTPLVTPENVQKCIAELYLLENTGALIKDLHQRQQNGRKKAHATHKEYVHKSTIKQPWNSSTSVFSGHK